jgi:hypothetical protein
MLRISNLPIGKGKHPEPDEVETNDRHWQQPLAKPKPSLRQQQLRSAPLMALPLSWR